MVRKRSETWDGLDGEEDFLTIAATMGQAKQALELAAKMAAGHNDAETMLNVAHGYMRMTETIIGISERAEGESDEESPKRQVGFGPPDEVTSKTEFAEYTEEYLDDSDED